MSAKFPPDSNSMKAFSAQLHLSNLFASGRVLTGFFLLCGTMVHKKQKKGLF